MLSSFNHLVDTSMKTINKGSSFIPGHFVNLEFRTPRQFQIAII